MDNVGCYGSESKLIECSYDYTYIFYNFYHPNISEDDHSEDIWVNCGAGAEETSSPDSSSSSGAEETSSPDITSGPEKSSNSVSAAELAIFLCISILGIINMFVVAFLVYNCLKKRNVNIRRRTSEM